VNLILLEAGALRDGGAVLEGTAVGKSVGSCPSGDGWTLVTVESLGLTEEQASGIPSLDGNGDGWTCTKDSPSNPESRPYDGFIFRDNTVTPPSG